MKNKILKNVIVILVITVLAKISSFFAEIVVAALLGTTEKADAFSIISGVHQIIYPMLSVGIWGLFLPEYKKVLIKESSEDADKLSNKVLSIFLIISMVASTIIWIFAKQLIDIIAIGFNEELKNVSINLLRIYSPYFVLVIISAIYAAMLQARENFLGSQIREVVSFLPTIFLGKLLYCMYDLNGLIYALLIGGICRLVIIFPFINWKYKFKFDFDFKDSRIIMMIKKVPSVLINTGITQINTLVDKMMATGLIIGSVASLNYGQKLINVVNGLLTSTVSTAIYPTMTQFVAEGKKNSLKTLIEKIIKILAIIIIPLSILVILFRKEIVTIVFKRGMFGDDSVLTTSNVFAFYAIGLYFIGIKSIFDHVFYSIGDTKSMMYISIVSVVLNISFNMILVKIFGIIGLSLATSISAILTIILNIILLRKYLKLELYKTLIFLLKIIGISIISIMIPYYIIDIIGISNLFIKIMLVIIFASIIYFIELLVFKIEEYKEIMMMAKTWLLKIKEKKENKNGNNKKSINV
ncbi:MAG: murein biosynthesis integral membrane protein MurJ [Clostridia bacterium]|nr:murein biosynthesis integral membrane protein MurJ [Clostridia bacterium]